MPRYNPRYYIESGLSESGINNLIQELRNLQSRIDKANSIFVERLAELGVNVANTHIVSTQGIDKEKDIGDVTFVINKSGGVVGTVIKFEGKQALFIEFGAGIYFNRGNNHPLAPQFGYGVGTYPNQKHAYDDYWWYRGEDDNLHLSKGTEATMPMYNASVEIRNKIIEIAREVFQSVI